MTLLEGGVYLVTSTECRKCIAKGIGIYESLEGKQRYYEMFALAWHLDRTISRRTPMLDRAELMLRLHYT